MNADTNEPPTPPEPAWVGIDVHARLLVIAAARPNDTHHTLWRFETTEEALVRLRVHLEAWHPGPIRCAYEAGSTGSNLKLVLEQSPRISCTLVHPKALAKARGRTAKTDAIDAQQLLCALRAGRFVPALREPRGDEGRRQLARLWSRARADQRRADQRLSAWLLLEGQPDQQSATKHRQNATPGESSLAEQARAGIDAALRSAIEEAEARTKVLEELLLSTAEPRLVAHLGCIHGVGPLSAALLASEIGDIRRFPSPRSLMAATGLVPRVRGTGGRTRRGPITKGGSPLLRHLLVQAAWHQRHPPSRSCAAARVVNQVRCAGCHHVQ